MPKLNAEAKLFGIDLQQCWLEIQTILQQLGDVLHLERYLPRSLARMKEQNARQVWLRGVRWLGDDMTAQRGLDSGEQSTPAALVLLLGNDSVLVRQVRLPTMPAKSLEAALALEVQTSSPFGADETLWAYRQIRCTKAEAALGHQVTLVLTSKALVSTAQEKVGIDASSNLEIWAEVASQPPLLIRGFGESVRLRKERKQNWYLLAGGVVVIGLLAVLAVSPTLQLRAKVLDAYDQLLNLAARTQEQTAQRQQLIAVTAQLDEFENQQAQQVNPIWVLKRLTEVLPNEVAIQSLQLKERSLIIQGIADDASAAMQRLGKEPGFHEVRFPSAVTRIPNAAKESFVLAAEIDPEVFGYRGESKSVNEQVKKAE